MQKGQTTAQKGIVGSATSRDAYDQLAAQLLASELNVANKVPVCDTVTYRNWIC